MNDERDEITLGPGDSVEALLAKASPRPVPPAEDARMIRHAVRAEWLDVTDRRRGRRRWLQLAAAASVLLAVFASLNALRPGDIEPARVAEIGKRFGSIYVLGDNAELLGGNNLTTVTIGQTLVTDNDSGIGLDWAAGGSLRIDQDTRVEFLSKDSIYLRSGRIYFDSMPGLSGKPTTGNALAVRTDFGEIRHVGTQFMAASDRNRLSVSVREGEVVVSRAGRSQQAAKGQQLAISGSGAFDTVNIGSHGGAWTWVEQTAPDISLDGHSVSAFLDWVSRETGLAVDYRSQRVRMSAEQVILNGTLSVPPREALDIWMLGTDLTWRIENGVIYVGETQ